MKLTPPPCEFSADMLPPVISNSCNVTLLVPLIVMTGAFFPAPLIVACGDVTAAASAARCVPPVLHALVVPISVNVRFVIVSASFQGLCSFVT